MNEQANRKREGCCAEFVFMMVGLVGSCLGISMQLLVCSGWLFTSPSQKSTSLILSYILVPKYDSV